MTEYIVEPKSRLQLRELARMLRRYLKLENEKYFPITELLDVLAEVFDNFSYEVVEDSELPIGTHADTDVRVGHPPMVLHRYITIFNFVKFYFWLDNPIVLLYKECK